MVILSVSVGIALGFLTGLGTGGGSLLLLWLTLVLDMDPERAKLINLMFFLPSATVATFLNLRRGTVPLRKILLPILTGCAAAAGTALIGKTIDTEQLKKLFGVLLIFTGIRELCYRPRKPK